MTSPIAPATSRLTRVFTRTAGSLGSLVQDGSTLNIDGHTITFKNAQTPQSAISVTSGGVSGNIVTDGNGNSTVYIQSATLTDLLADDANAFTAAMRMIWEGPVNVVALDDMAKLVNDQEIFAESADQALLHGAIMNLARMAG